MHVCAHALTHVRLTAFMYVCMHDAWYLCKHVCVCVYGSIPVLRTSISRAVKLRASRGRTSLRDWARLRCTAAHSLHTNTPYRNDTHVDAAPRHTQTHQISTQRSHHTRSEWRPTDGAICLDGGRGGGPCHSTILPIFIAERQAPSKWTSTRPSSASPSAPQFARQHHATESGRRAKGEASKLGRTSTFAVGTGSIGGQREELLHGFADASAGRGADRPFPH